MDALVFLYRSHFSTRLAALTILYVSVELPYPVMYVKLLSGGSVMHNRRHPAMDASSYIVWPIRLLFNDCIVKLNWR